MQPDQLSRQLQDDGYAFVPRWHSALSTREVASFIGRIIEIDALLPGSGIPTVQTLMPRNERDAPRTQYSGVFGLQEFPLHTDLAHWAKPPRYFMLRCISGSAEVATRLLPAFVLMDAIGENVLRRALVKPRRSRGSGTASLLTLIFSIDHTPGFRWDSLFLTPMNAAAREVLDIMTSRTEPWQGHKEFVLCNPGDTLLIDNWRLLHGRSPADLAKTRIIERVYLSEMYL